MQETLARRTALAATLAAGLTFPAYAQKDSGGPVERPSRFIPVVETLGRCRRTTIGPWRTAVIDKICVHSVSSVVDVALHFGLRDALAWEELQGLVVDLMLVRDCREVGLWHNRGWLQLSCVQARINEAVRGLEALEQRVASEPASVFEPGAGR